MQVSLKDEVDWRGDHLLSKYLRVLQILKTNKTPPFSRCVVTDSTNEFVHYLYSCSNSDRYVNRYPECVHTQCIHLLVHCTSRFFFFFELRLAGYLEFLCLNFFVLLASRRAHLTTLFRSGCGLYHSFGYIHLPVLVSRLTLVYPITVWGCCLMLLWI